MAERTPPPELVAQALKMKNDYFKDKGFTVEPYFHSSELGFDEWRFRIVNDHIADKYKRIVVEHLSPEKIDGYTCSLFCATWMNAMNDGIEKGKMQQIKKLMEEACVSAGLTAAKHLAYLNDGQRENELMLQLRDQQRLRTW